MTSLKLSRSSGSVNSMAQVFGRFKSARSECNTENGRTNERKGVRESEISKLSAKTSGGTGINLHIMVRHTIGLAIITLHVQCTYVCEVLPITSIH